MAPPERGPLSIRPHRERLSIPRFPGTVAAGVGEGRLDYLIPGGAGLYVGAIVYGLSYDRIMPSLTRVGRLGAVTIADLVHAEPWLVILVFAEMALLTFYAIARTSRAPFVTRSSGAPRSGRPHSDDR